MFKKLGYILIGLVVLTLALSGVASADNRNPPATGSGANGVRWGRGEVTALGADSLTLQGLRGPERTLYVDSATNISDEAGQALTFKDIQVGSRIIGSATQHEDGKWYALVLHVLPPRTDYKGAGVVASVDDEENSFVFVNRKGRVWEFYVDGDTTYTNREAASMSFADVRTGTRLFVQAELRADGKWWATEIKTGRKVNP